MAMRKEDLPLLKPRVFEHKRFGKIRIVVIDGVVWFVGKDVAIALGYKNPQKAIRDHVDEEDQKVNESFTLGRGSAPVLINKSEVYSLILDSQLPDAKQLRHWVTSEVLPQIDETGSYVGQQPEPETISIEIIGHDNYLLLEKKYPEIVNFKDGYCKIGFTDVPDGRGGFFEEDVFYLQVTPEGYEKLRRDVVSPLYLRRTER